MKRPILSAALVATGVLCLAAADAQARGELRGVCAEDGRAHTRGCQWHNTGAARAVCGADGLRPDDELKAV